MLQEEAADEGQDGFVPDLEKINTAGRHLLALINDILDLSKIEAGKTEVHLEEVDLPELIREVEATVTPLVNANENRLAVELNGVGRVVTDVTKVRQILLNLLSNASKFTERGRIDLAVRPCGEDSDDFLIRVADSGIGMTEEQVDRLFQAFNQADASVAKKYGGTGLGLVISRRFSRLLGGDIEVESRKGVGTTFTVRLPRDATGRVAVAGSDTGAGGEPAAASPSDSHDAISTPLPEEAP
jgi:signal transduction histidine kinase